MTRPWVALSLLLTAIAPARAQDEHAGVRVRGWYARMGGSLSGDGETLSGTEIDLGSDLGLDDPEFTSEVQVYGQIPDAGRISAGWWRVHRDADEVLSRTITFADQVYTGTTRVKSEIELNVYSLAYEFLFPSIPMSDLVNVELGLLVGTRIIDAEGSIESGFASGRDSGIIAIPVLGGHAALQVAPWLRTDLELSGFASAYPGRRGAYFEATGEVVAQPFPWLFAGVGYRFVLLELSDRSGSTEFDLEMSLSGLYLTVGAGF